MFLYQRYTSLYSRKLHISERPLDLNVGLDTCLINSERLNSFETILNFAFNLGSTKCISLNLSKPEYIGVECSTSNIDVKSLEPFLIQITSISCITSLIEEYLSGRLSLKRNVFARSI